MARKGYSIKSRYLTFDPDGISVINRRILYQDSESSKASRGETNKITKSILEMPQETCPANFQVKVTSAFQSVFQVPIQLNIR